MVFFETMAELAGGTLQTVAKAVRTHNSTSILNRGLRSVGVEILPSTKTVMETWRTERQDYTATATGMCQERGWPLLLEFDARSLPTPWKSCISTHATAWHKSLPVSAVLSMSKSRHRGTGSCREAQKLLRIAASAGQDLKTPRLHVSMVLCCIPPTCTRPLFFGVCRCVVSTAGLRQPMQARDGDAGNGRNCKKAEQLILRMDRPVCAGGLAYCRPSR